jgi:hypothetical protein
MRRDEQTIWGESFAVARYMQRQEAQQSTSSPILCSPSARWYYNLGNQIQIRPAVILSHNTSRLRRLAAISLPDVNSFLILL